MKKVLLALLLSSPVDPSHVLAQAQERVYEWGWGMHPMLLFWVLVIVGLVVGIRWLVSQARQPKSDAALEILRQRYARGEINNEEFEARKKDLTL